MKEGTGVVGVLPPLMLVVWVVVGAEGMRTEGVIAAGVGVVMAAVALTAVSVSTRKEVESAETLEPNRDRSGCNASASGAVTEGTGVVSVVPPLMLVVWVVLGTAGMRTEGVIAAGVGVVMAAVVLTAVSVSIRKEAENAETLEPN